MLMLLLVALLLGLAEGFVRLALGVVSLAVGGVLVLAFADPAAGLLSRWVASPEAALLLGSATVLAVTLLGFTGLGWVLRRLVRGLGLAVADRLLGATVAVFLLLLGAAVLSRLAVAVTPGSAMVQRSRLIGPLARLERGLEARLPAPTRQLGERALAGAERRLRGLSSGTAAASDRQRGR